MSSDVVSYYDWSIGFKKSSGSHNSTKQSSSVNATNSIGIADKEFKSFLKKWKEENLSG